MDQEEALGRERRPRTALVLGSGLGDLADRLDDAVELPFLHQELFGEYRDLKVTEQQWFDGQWVPRQTLEKFGVLEPERADEPGAKEVEA